jgi:hypothetical protein
MITVKATVRMREIVAGTISPAADANGNPRYHAASAVTDESMTFWSEGGARLFLSLQAQLHG